jgi:hypothetical protein
MITEKKRENNGLQSDPNINPPGARRSLIYADEEKTEDKKTAPS